MYEPAVGHSTSFPFCLLAASRSSSRGEEAGGRADLVGRFGRVRLRCGLRSLRMHRRCLAQHDHEPPQLVEVLQALEERERQAELDFLGRQIAH